MKKHLYIFVAVAAMLLQSCAAGWLEQYPEGGSITEKQFKDMENALEGSVLGIYSSMYQFGGDHDVFGQRSIDMYGDFTCGDMAMSTRNYGWFSSDDMGQAYTRRAYLWVYYYDIIRLCNKSLNAFNEKVDMAQKNDSTFIMDHSSLFYYYAEILGMRGWAYANLQKWFCYTRSYIAGHGYDDTYLSIPLYTEEVTVADTTLGNPLSSVKDVYARIEEDLTTAIYYFDLLEGNGIRRSLKQEMCGDVARLTLAYNYLNGEEYDKAAAMADEFISKTTYTILPRNELNTTGFAEINSNNWVWGQDVNVQTTTSLASFFGQCDIYSYSYAWAGDVKGIDENLLKELTDKHKWDARTLWFNQTYTTAGIKGCQYAPDGKFYSPSVQRKVGYTRKAKSTELDRDWLCDHVFMRTELAYLIAAEAYYRLAAYGDASAMTKAIDRLTAITDERKLDGKDSEYSTWKASLSSEATLRAEIKYNWRIELWGEGFALQTARRFDEKVTLGNNHLRADKDFEPNGNNWIYKTTFEIPSSEQYYNPWLNSDVTTLATDE